MSSSVIGLSRPVHEFMLLIFSFFLVSGGQFGGSHSVNTLELNHKEVLNQGVAIGAEVRGQSPHIGVNRDPNGTSESLCRHGYGGNCIAQ